MVVSIERRLFVVAIAAERVVCGNIKTFFQYQFFPWKSTLYVSRDSY